MQVNRKRGIKCDDQGPAPIGQEDIKQLLTSQQETNTATILSRRGGVEFHQEGVESDKIGTNPPSSVEETIALDDAVAKERLLRYPGGVSKLAHLAVQKKNYLQTKKQQPSTEDSGRGHSVPVGASQGYIPSSPVPLLPVPVIERHKLTPAEIRALPRFGKYDPGTPSKVLYIKNVHRRVTSDDLMSLFGRFSTTAKSSEGVKIRLLSGRMRGQAFVEFKSVSIAIEALELANGYKMYGKPLVISYGKRY